MKILSPRAHAPLDYALALVFLVAPRFLHFSDIPSTLSYVVGASVLTLSLLTAYTLGAAKWIPFPVHGMIELIAAPALIASPWVLDFSEASVATGFFVSVGIAYLLVWAITDYKRAEKDETERFALRQPEPRHPV